MVLLQPKLSLKVAQRQILTPGLMQMVSVLALNKLELKEMINSEIVENPVLEELEESVPLLDDIAGKEAERDRSAQEIADQADQSPAEKSDPFDEIDFGSYFQDYLDPGFRTSNNVEMSERPSFENFLSQPGTLADHLFWQLGSLSVSHRLRDAAEYIVGNLDEDGYLPANDEELLIGYLREQTGEGGDLLNAEEAGALLEEAIKLVRTLDPVGVGTRSLRECLLVQIDARRQEFQLAQARRRAALGASLTAVQEDSSSAGASGARHLSGAAQAAAGSGPHRAAAEAASGSANGMSPNGVANGSIKGPASESGNGSAPASANGRPGAHEEKQQSFLLASRIVDQHLSMLQKRDLREMSRVLSAPCDAVQQAIDLIRSLDPRPGQRYNRSEARLIEPDVAFVKRDNDYVVVMNEEDLPTLRLNQGYRKLLSQDGTEKEVKDYVKERYRSALQLMRNIEQRKNTIMRTCEAIVRRQRDFLESGVEALKPMMIKDVAEEIGVHPSTVSRAVSSKYVHTSQGVFELRFFFSEGVSGPEGSGTPLMLLKRKVKKFIEEEDPHKPLTDDLIASMLQTQGIEVTRRTVAKYREDLRIPSTHQRRIRG